MQRKSSQEFKLKSCRPPRTPPQPGTNQPATLLPWQAAQYGPACTRSEPSLAKGTARLLARQPLDQLGNCTRPCLKNDGCHPPSPNPCSRQARGEARCLHSPAGSRATPGSAPSPSWGSSWG